MVTPNTYLGRQLLADLLEELKYHKDNPGGGGGGGGRGG